MQAPFTHLAETMFYRLRRWHAVHSQAWLREIRQTPPLRTESAGPVFVSQLGSVFTDMYLIAVKSVARWCPPSRVVILDDGTLGARDVALLRRHIPGVDIRAVRDVNVGRCPRGGTWERLVTCSDESRDRFVLQIDSDTVTPQQPEQVLDCVRSNVSYTMSGYVESVDPELAVRRLSLSDAAHVRSNEVAIGSEPHIQIAAEIAMERVTELAGSYYYRGCSGFAGFAAGAVTRPDIERYSLAMHAVLGERWSEWGTEQVTSNYVIANAPGSQVLEWPTYVGMMRGINEPPTRMIHFTGHERFSFGVYQRAAASAIQTLGNI